MDSLMIFDANNYLVYVKYNRLFLSEISSLIFKSKLSDLSSKRKVKQMLSKDYKQLENLIVLIFAPYVASIRVLGLDCPPLDIFQDKFPKIRIIHAQFLDYIFLYISDSTNFTNLKQMDRHLDVFVSISKMLFGVALGDIRGDDSQMHLLTSMFNNWLANKTCPIYLVEATERLIVSQSIQKTFVDLLRSTLTKICTNIERFSEEIPSHAMLFVERKLLARSSSRNAAQISKGDLVLITLMVDTLQGLHEYYSEEEDKLKTLVSSQEEYDGDDDESDDYSSQGSCTSRSSSHGRVIQESDRVSYKWKEMDHRVVFFHSSVDQRYLVPFYLRYIRLADEVSLVILSQLPTTLMTFHIHNLLNILNFLQYQPKELRCSHTLHEFDVSLAKLLRHLSETKTRSDIIRTLIAKLNQVSKSDIRKQILNFDGEEISAQLDSLSSSVSSILKTVYSEKIYLYHQRSIERLQADPVLNNFVLGLKNDAFNFLKDYLDYFHVKSQRNMAIEAYVDIIPGLVGFIYVDRNTNEFIMAKVDDGDDSIGDFNLLDLNLSINVMPQLVETAYTNLSNGRLISTWSENGLSFNNIIWFENETGEILKLPENGPEGMHYPSLMSDNFIDKLLLSCFPSYRLGPSANKGHNILCFELFYIQKLSSVKSCDQTVQAKRLAQRLYSITSFNQAK